MHETKQLVKKFLKKNNYSEAKTIQATELYKVHLINSSSDIINSNNGVLYCFKIKGLEGIFSKNKESKETISFGREVCDIVKDKFNNKGFFTSDELPRYKIELNEKHQIEEAMKKEPGELIIILSYDREKSEEIRSYLIQYFNSIISAAE